MHREEGKEIMVISGKIGDTEGPIVARQPTELYDFKLTDTTHEFEVKEGWTCVIYVHEGNLQV